jgi:hypothetical protein
MVKGAERSIRIHTDASGELVADRKMKEDLKKSSHATLMKFFQDPMPGRTHETHFRSFSRSLAGAPVICDLMERERRMLSAIFRTNERGD